MSTALFQRLAQFQGFILAHFGFLDLFGLFLAKCAIFGRIGRKRQLRRVATPSVVRHGAAGALRVRLGVFEVSFGSILVIFHSLREFHLCDHPSPFQVNQPILAAHVQSTPSPERT